MLALKNFKLIKISVTKKKMDYDIEKKTIIIIIILGKKVAYEI
jgi:hypothetical protein